MWGLKRLMKNKESYLKLTTVLLRTNQHVTDVIKNDIIYYDLNTTEFGTLEVLYHKGKQPIQSVGEKMLMANSSMTYVVDKLVKRGFISKVQDEKDRRNTLIDLTNEGKDFFESIFDHHVETLTQIYDILSPNETDELIKLLKKVGYRAKEIQGGKK